MKLHYSTNCVFGRHWMMTNCDTKISFSVRYVVTLFSLTCFTLIQKELNTNLMLWHCFSHFLPNSRAIACWVAELYALLSSAPEWRNKISFLAVSHTQKGKLREPSVKTLCSLLYTEFLRQYVLIDVTRPAFASTPEWKKWKYNFLNFSSRDTTHNQSRLQSHFVPLHHS